ncbi:hypothetical protein ACOSQ4_021210 [Xanthoceras sorbifolium]
MGRRITPPTRADCGGCNGPGRSTALARPRYSQVLSALGALRRRPSRLSFASLIRIRTWYLSISTKPYQVEYQLSY